MRRIREPPLLSGLDDDGAAVFDFDVQVVAVQQPHTHEGSGVCGVCQDVSWPAVPEQGNVVCIECYLADVGKGCPANPLKGQPQLRDQRRRYGQESGEASVYYGFDILRLPLRALHCQDDDGFIGGVHYPLDHSALRQGRPPK